MNAAPAADTRPRVEGDRELEILTAALEVMADVGYDRLTMDAVATRAKASKATLYRRWKTKADLVIEAIIATKGPTVIPDNGNLRQDLLDMFCGLGGMTDGKSINLLGSLITAIHRDEEFAAAYRRDFVGPKLAASRTVYERAQARGEIRADIDVDLLSAALPGIVLHRVYILGELPTQELIAKVIDQIILPAGRPVSS
jgi:AcrR family transcriptional regulator